MSLSILQEQLGVAQSSSSILENSNQILSDAIKIQTLRPPWIFNSNSRPNFEKKSYKEICSLFDSLQMHILFEIFGAW
jgi:hypothetical protein